MGKVILCIATLDTKGAEAEYAKQLIESRGHSVLVMDIGCQREPSYPPDITAEEIAKKAGSLIQDVRALKEVGPAVKIMATGATEIAKDLNNKGGLDGVLCIGGGTGATIGSAVMRGLPIGLPKFLLSSQKIVQAGIETYVGSKDIAVMPSIADVSSLNRLTRKAISNAVGAIVGMVESPEPESSEKPLVFITMLGTTSICGLKVRSRLENAGFEVVIFHTIGIGGKTLEDAIERYPVSGVIELSINEIGNYLFGGLASAGPNRLEAAGKKGIPQVITPGLINFINFLGPETVPQKFRDRRICYHNPQSTAPRLNAEELKLAGKTIAAKLNLATGPVKVIIPNRGFSALEYEGSIYNDPASNRMFIDTLEKSLKKTIEVREIDANINDDEFAEVVAEAFLSMVRT